MRLKVLDEAYKNAFFYGCPGWLPIQNDGLCRKGDKESIPNENVIPGSMEKIVVNREMEERELDFILYVKEKYGKVKLELKREIVRIRVDQAKNFIEALLKTIHSQSTAEKNWTSYYYEEYQVIKQTPDIQDFLKACNVLPQGGWVIEADIFLEPIDAFFELCDDYMGRIPALLEFYRALLEETLLESGNPSLESSYQKKNQLRERNKTEKERRKIVAFRKYDVKMKSERPLKSERSIIQDVADEMHVDKKTIQRYLKERTNGTE